MTENLIDGLLAEIERNLKILEIYKGIPAGSLAAHFIRQEVDNAKQAISSGDTIAMIKCFKILQENKL